MPSPTFLDDSFGPSDHTPALKSLQRMFTHGRLAGTGYVSILPVDQGIEHSAGASFAPNPRLLRSREHREARDRRRLQRRRLDARRARHRRAQVRAQDPVHREDQPQRVPHLPEQVRPDRCSATSSRRFDMGAVARRRDDLLRLGRSRAGRSYEVAEAFQQAHELGMVTVLWCYLRNTAFKTTTRTTTPVRRPHRPGQPPRRDDRGRHHQAEAARATTAATRRSRAQELRQDRTRRSTPS